LQKLGLVIFAAMMTTAPLAIAAQTDDILLTACAFSKGDPASKVKQFYGLASEPRRLEKPIPGGTTFDYHPTQYGVWIFFDNALVVSSVRFDAPFRGKIGGIAIGDDVDRVLSIKGEPARKFQGFADAVASERRQQKVLDVINALPDPSPKVQVATAVEQIINLVKAPPELTTAWVYNPEKPGSIRYDIGIAGVQSILVTSCQPEM
jgi:hypothetical protein